MNYKLIYLARRNPSVSQEDWPATWLSHAKFAGQFPMIRPNFSSIHYCTRVITPTVNGSLFHPPQSTRQFDGVAVVGCPAVDGLNVQVPPDVLARIEQDELRVFSGLTPNFSFKAREELVHGDSPGFAAIFRFLARKAGSSAEDFQAHWRGRHAETAKRAADTSGIVTRYVHNGLLEEPPSGYPFDGISETWFASAEDAARSFADDAFKPVTEDIAGFCDPGLSVTIMTRVIRCWPQTD